MRPYNPHKLAFRSKKCIFLGYSSNHHGYHCLDLTTHRIFSSRDVVFNELDFLAKTTPSLPLPNEVSRSVEHVLLPLPSSLGNSLSFSTLPQANTQPLPIDQTPPIAPPDDTQPLPTDLTPPIPDLPLTTQLVEPIPAPTTSHHMVTPSMTNASHPKPFHDHLLYYSTCHPLKAFLANALPSEPSTFFQAYKVPEWRAAMEAEFGALIANVTSTHTAHLLTLTKHLQVEFPLKDLGELSYFLGIHVIHDSKGVHLSQSKYISDLLHRAHMVGAKPSSTPTTPGSKLSQHSVNQLCQFMHSPTTAHWTTAKRVLRYLKGTIDHGLLFSPRLTSLTCLFTEAKYRAMVVTTADLYWIHMLLKNLHVPLRSPPTLWCDNASPLAIASNPVFHARTKHIEVDYHFIWEKVLNKDLFLQFTATGDQRADIFTKGLSAPRFTVLRDKLLVTSCPISLRGAVKEINPPHDSTESAVEGGEELNLGISLSPPEVLGGWLDLRREHRQTLMMMTLAAGVGREGGGGGLYALYGKKGGGGGGSGGLRVYGVEGKLGSWS
uniref:Uncharacterized protein n=1 Tax=Fagus sylvatica TaxID=28930 RepID=A0A2N9I2K1_FAGSY